MYEDILKASFTKYINMIIKNTANTYFRRKRHREDKEKNIDEFEDVLLSSDNGTIFLGENNISSRNIEKVFSNLDYYNAMKSLTDRQKLILYLNAVENYTTVEIGKC